MVEADVRVDKQGVLILSHNKDENRDCPGHVRLADVFSLALEDGSLAVNCGVKKQDAVPAIRRLGVEIEMERLILTGSFSPAMIRENPGMVKAARLGLNVEEPGEEYYHTSGLYPLWQTARILGQRF